MPTMTERAKVPTAKKAPIIPKTVPMHQGILHARLWQLLNIEQQQYGLERERNVATNSIVSPKHIINGPKKSTPKKYRPAGAPLHPISPETIRDPVHVHV